jgi:hypothetical protein
MLAKVVKSATACRTNNNVDTINMGDNSIQQGRQQQQQELTTIVENCCGVPVGLAAAETMEKFKTSTAEEILATAGTPASSNSRDANNSTTISREPNGNSMVANN